MNDAKEIQFTITQQGAPVVNTAWVQYESDGCICIEMDLKSKYCDIQASGGHSIFIGAGEHSLHLKEGVDHDLFTVVQFSLPPGRWSFFAGGGGRYTLTAVFLKEPT